MLIYSSPWLIAVSHVLLRLLMPRHSPYALCNLNLLFSYFALSFAISFYRFGCLFFYHPLVAKLQFLTFFLGKTNFYLFLLLSQYLFVCFIRFSMIICNHSNSALPVSDVSCFRLRNEVVQTSNETRPTKLALSSGRSGWTRTIDLALIRRAL